MGAKGDVFVPKNLCILMLDVPNRKLLMFVIYDIPRSLFDTYAPCEALTYANQWLKTPKGGGQGDVYVPE
jgi:hypothetical protein